MGKGFLAFLKEYGVIGLALGVIIGAKVGGVVSTLVDGIVMPFVGLITPAGDWRSMGFELQSGNPASLVKVGALAGALLDFLIVALLVYWFAKKVLKEEKVTKK
jgi:large conductance mechanosensitive channel